MKTIKINENVYKFINKNYKAIITGLLTIMAVCVLNITINTAQYFTECNVREEMTNQQEQTIAEMQIQTDLLLNQNGYKWNGAKVEEISNKN